MNEFTWSWTNWTFGIWWDRRKLKAFGIDIGPFEYMRKFNAT